MGYLNESNKDNHIYNIVIQIRQTILLENKLIYTY